MNELIPNLLQLTRDLFARFHPQLDNLTDIFLKNAEDSVAGLEIDLALREKLRAIEFRAFFLPVESIGTFPPKASVKIIWIGVGQGHPHLFQLHKRVQEAALSVGIEPELRSWHPHFTLARCRDVSRGALSKFLKSNAHMSAGMFRVDAFHLYCSELTPAGPIHTCELSIPAR